MMMITLMIMMLVVNKAETMMMTMMTIFASIDDNDELAVRSHQAFGPDIHLTIGFKLLSSIQITSQ